MAQHKLALSQKIEPLTKPGGREQAGHGSATPKVPLFGSGWTLKNKLNETVLNDFLHVVL